MRRMPATAQWPLQAAGRRRAWGALCPAPGSRPRPPPNHRRHSRWVDARTASSARGGAPAGRGAPGTWDCRARWPRARRAANARLRGRMHCRTHRSRAPLPCAPCAAVRAAAWRCRDRRRRLRRQVGRYTVRADGAGL